MPKSYFNNAIVGNSSMLGCISDRGELLRLYWPNIDYPQHIDAFKTGILLPDTGRGTSWLDSGEWRAAQRYIGDTNILETLYTGFDGRYLIRQTDFVLPDKPVLARRYELEHKCQESGGDICLIAYSSSVSTNPHPSGVIFDYGLDSLIHYRHDYYISVSAHAAAWKFQLGGDAFQSACSGRFRGNDNIGMMHDGVVAWLLPADGNLTTSVDLYICASHTLKGVRELTREVKNCDGLFEYERTVSYWTGFLKEIRTVNTGSAAIDELYRRSALVFMLMADEGTGGLLAAPEIDEEFTKCGRYAYCWGRDAAFITTALDWCGLAQTAGRFYRWAARTQEEEGYWQQRYHMDGNLAPSWGMQIDETGSVVWGILKHFEAAGDKEFLEEMWECVRRAVTFMAGYLDRETGLPWLSFDIWEERLGEHAYSAAAVYAGILAGCKIGGILGKSEALLQEWKKAAAGVKAALEENFYKTGRSRFIRSVRVKLNPWGEEHGDRRVLLKLDNKDNYRDFTLEDWTADISLLGLCVPFGVFEASDARMAKTAEVLESVLSGSQAGGLKRYENDGYIGGNPWIIASLWAALYRIERKDYAGALQYLHWAVNGRTSLGFLPEQSDRDTGEAAWVIPLTWSHAMFVLVLGRLIEAGVVHPEI